MMYREISSLLADEARREKMASALRSMVQTDSAEQICGILEQLMKL